MGKNQRERKEIIQQAKIERKKTLENIYYRKNSWARFWRRIDFWIYAVCLSAIIVFPFVPKKQYNIFPDQAKQKSSDEATIHTTMGDIRIKLFTSDAPKTVDNFKKLSQSGFYNSLTWHRIIKEFMIQAGDPNGDGTGGPGYQFEDEINSHKIVKGTVAMANSGPNTNGSQFFIVTEKPQPHLDGKHTVFGEVISGMEVVKKIADAPTDDNDKPLTSILIQNIEIK